MGVSSESQSYTNFVYFQEFHTVFVGNQPECDVSAYRRADADGAVAENSRCCDRSGARGASGCSLCREVLILQSGGDAGA